ncbi:MAG: HAMP domain-containing sensor histidine kinase [Croceibacterium sp.]
MNSPASFTARARTDARDWLVEADEPLAGLQLRAGGDMPGLIVSPALLELVRKARTYGLRLARAIEAHDDAERIRAWVEVTPLAGGDGCTIALADWQAEALSEGGGADTGAWRAAIVAQLAELSARLGPDQQVLAVESHTPDLTELAGAMRDGLGRGWTDFVGVEGQSPHPPLHWRLLDGARVAVAGSQRAWRAHLMPLGAPTPGSGGFELHLVADEPPAVPAPESVPAPPSPASVAIGREIAPVLRQPIARIIANAETIRSQLAGPLAGEYSDYAADIASAGEHLLALLDDLIALEAVEDAHFAPTPAAIDLAEVARQAAGILGVRARERGIAIEAPTPEETVPAIGEFRRVLQVLLNLLGNAIRYSPEGSQVSVRIIQEGARARVVVADQGEGFSDEQRARLFEKFERLGRSGDGGTGLGLFISRRLARAMGGDLTVESTPGQGARFILDLPGNP